MKSLVVSVVIAAVSSVGFADVVSVPLDGDIAAAVESAQLALDLGFSNASHFVRAFKQVTGSTFSQWQKSISAKE